MNELERKYTNFFVNHTENMSIADAERYLELLREAPPKWMSALDIDERITNLRRYVEKHCYIEKQRADRVARDREQGDIYRSLTDKWLAAGAYYSPDEKYDPRTTWYYRDESFFSWKSGESFAKVVERAQEADVEFEELRKGER